MISIKENKSGGGRDLSPFGAFSTGEQILFSLRIHASFSVKSVVMVIHGDGWGKETSVWKEYPFGGETDGQWQLCLDMGQLCADTSMDEGGLLYYHYRIHTADERVLFYGGEEPAALTPLTKDFAGERQLLVYDAAYTAPAAFGEGILYHIFVDRFAKTGAALTHCKKNAVIDPDWEKGVPQYGEYPGAEVANNVFFGGDLYGVAEKLDYIASLGTGTIYLSPVFEAASNHKYDTGDYLAVDPMFGGDRALENLCREAGKRGIRVILDGVFNHTGADSVYFNKEENYASVGAYQSQESPYAHWYHFREFPDTYECWWGVKILPRVNSGDSSYQRFIYEKVIPKWMDAGVYGWRLDVADELTADFLEGLRRAVRERNPDAAIIGEVWEDASDKVSYGERRQYLLGRQLDGVMNYPLRDAVIAYVRDGDAEALRKGTEFLYRRYPKWASDNQMNFLGTHDTIRILTALGGEDQEAYTNAQLAEMHMTEAQRKTALARLKTAYALLAAMPGVPCVFYGDEAGMEGYRDPFCRRPFPWHNIDEDLLEFYRKIGRLRKAESVLKTGVLRLLQVTEEGVLFVRDPWNGEEYRIVVAVNRSGKNLFLRIPAEVRELIGDCRILMGQYSLQPGQTVYLRCPVAVPAENFILQNE
ncbi:MAG: glycoside hydrolase family 13 protein [Clostridia bacterium]|nr:glycoside hydrolase family 13 protein [Clostridia bacterium]